MARKQVKPDYNHPFAKRMRSLFDKTKDNDGKTMKVKKHADLADRLKITRQAVNSYTLGDSFPNIMILAEIASFFHVSTDYLLGRTDNKNIDNFPIGEATGLADGAIQWLASRKDEDTFELKVINTLLSNHDLADNFCHMIAKYAVDRKVYIKEVDEEGNDVNLLNIQYDLETSQRILKAATLDLFSNLLEVIKNQWALDSNKEIDDMRTRDGYIQTDPNGNIV